MGGVVSGITDAVGLTDTEDAGDQARKAADTQAAYQREALEYLKEREALPQEFRERALTTIGGLYGIAPPEGTDPGESQAEILERVTSAPFYTEGVQRGEEALLRNVAATGGLRSGNAQEALAGLNQQFLQQAYESELQGLRGLASLPSNAAAIAAGTAGIGQTLAQGRVASAQSDISAQNQLLGDVVGLGTTALTGFNIGGFSDIRLKENIKPAGSRNGHKWFKWRWNKLAEPLGLSGESEGVMAHLVSEYMPEAIGTKDGYITVNYQMLGAK